MPEGDGDFEALRDQIQSLLDLVPAGSRVAFARAVAEARRRGAGKLDSSRDIDGELRSIGERLLFRLGVCDWHFRDRVAELEELVQKLDPPRS